MKSFFNAKRSRHRGGVSHTEIFREYEKEDEMKIMLPKFSNKKNKFLAFIRGNTVCCTRLQYIVHIFAKRNMMKTAFSAHPATEPQWIKIIMIFGRNR